MIPGTAAPPNSVAALDPGALGPAVLIGTPATLRMLREQLALLPEPPRVVGAILAGADAAPAPTPAAPVLGSLESLAAAREALGVRAAIVSLPASMAATLVEVRGELARLGIAGRIVPPLEDLLAAPPAPPAAPAPPARLDMGALIGRRPHDLDRHAVSRILRGKRVLITGAGGSIGSEIARIVAEFEPECLTLMDRSENALFEIDRRLGARFPAVARRALLHDVVDGEQTLRLLVQCRPHAVFHAAAHKHVPLMEDHPAHALINNLFGTKSIADAALAVGAERFVLVSTDKAVNPVSVMGATKRLAELYIGRLHAAAHAGRPDARETGPTDSGPTRFSMVRFGNVLGSACSVLEIWSAQIAEGLPLTVTDPRMTRYFMTIPEAAGLVIQAAAIETGDPPHAAVYVLDMGQPVSILDLAQRFIRAHGLHPLVQAGPAEGAPPGAPSHRIVFTGIRPGEKLHEELAYAAEHLAPTGHPGVRSWRGRPGTAADATAMIAELSALKPGADPALVVAAIRRHVPEMARPVAAAA